VSARTLDIIFVSVAVVGALVSARYYVVGVLIKDRLLSRSAAIAFAVFGVAAMAYWWRVM
jgi:hypothetical protein